MPQRNHYQILGVAQTASQVEIKRKYRELARKYHPDCAQDKELGLRVFMQATRSYHVLMHPGRRAEYDAQLAGDQADPAVKQASVNAAANSAALVNLVWEAEACAGASQYPRAKEKCEAALLLDPRHPQALSILGDAQAALGNLDDALKAYDRALAVGPSALLEMKRKRVLTMIATKGAVTPQAARPVKVTPSPGAYPSKTQPGLLQRLFTKSGRQQSRNAYH